MFRHWRKFATAPKIWNPHLPTFIPFLLVDSCCKNKTRTNEPEIYWKNKNGEPHPKWSGSYQKKLSLNTFRDVLCIIWLVQKFISVDVDARRSKTSKCFPYGWISWMRYHCNRPDWPVRLRQSQWIYIFLIFV